jgi:hypothetical protein
MFEGSSMVTLLILLLAAAVFATLAGHRNVRLLFLLFVIGVGICHGREKPDAPRPKVAARKLTGGKAFWILTSLHSGSAFYDGITTKQLLDRCPPCDEGDTFSRSFIGRRPGWGSMAPWGSVEVIGAAFVGAKMRRSQHKILQKFWWAPQLGFTALHLKEGTGNIFVCPGGCKN